MIEQDPLPERLLAWAWRADAPRRSSPASGSDASHSQFADSIKDAREEIIPCEGKIFCSTPWKSLTRRDQPDRLLLQAYRA